MGKSSRFFFAILLFLFGNIPTVHSQELVQTIRGAIMDVDTRSPLIGAEIIIVNSNPFTGTTSDNHGHFRIENIPIGRLTLQISFLGYEQKIIPNIVVQSGKEVVLHIALLESTIEIDEIIIKGSPPKGVALNEMAILSTRSISPEETERFAGGFNDPSRIVSAFAGVATSNDGDNDIIARGNSPKYLQWRLEGVEITNPTHFGDQNAVRGGVSALNNNLLTASDFSTGAFTAEYGDVLSAVYDVKLRAGNNEKFESTFGFGLLGTDLTFEGPFKKGYGGSYLVNYRYSTVSIINDLGLVNIDGLFKFQDAAFKILLPTNKLGVFSIFGLNGSSSFFLDNVKPDLFLTPGDEPISPDIVEDYEKDTDLLNLGLSHTFPVNDNSYVKTSVSFSKNGIKENIYESTSIKVFDRSQGEYIDSLYNTTLDFKNQLTTSSYRGSINYINKINSKNKIKIGTRFNRKVYNYNQSWLQSALGTRFTAIDFKENIDVVNNFINWKHRISDDITFVGGLHNMNVLFNSKHTIEPRIAMRWNTNKSSSFSLGYGLHSKMESIHHYFAKVETTNGDITEPNNQLDPLKSHHLVLGYETRLKSNIRAKVELYYQHLFDIPVENNLASSFSTLNEGNEFKYVELVNEGKGKNMGIEVTVERFFQNNYYFLINASLYDSKYTSLDGTERNTRYNGKYIINCLMGREFLNLGKKRNRTLSLNAKLFFGGGKRSLSLLRDSSGELLVDLSKNRIWDYDNAYSDKLDDIYQIILSASYKINRSRATHEIFINLDNITNTKGRLSEYYDTDEPNNIGYVTQFGFFPNLMYRVYF